MKTIFKLFILNLLALALLPSCSDDDQSNSEQNDPVSGNISPVGSFSVEATNNENELLVKWTNPSNRDVDMVERLLQRRGSELVSCYRLLAGTYHHTGRT